MGAVLLAAVAAPIADRRIAEVSADRHGHSTPELALGTSDQRSALSVLSRTVRDLAADASWRDRIRPWGRTS